MCHDEISSDQCVGGEENAGYIRSFVDYQTQYFYKKQQKYWAYTTDGHKSKAYRSKTEPFSGEKIMKAIIKTLDKKLLSIKLYSYQMMFIKTILPCVSKLLYGDEWKERHQEILDRLGWSRGYQEALYRAARRMGKTLTLSFFCLVVASHLPKFPTGLVRFAVFAVNLDNATLFINECEKNWKEMPIEIQDKYEMTRTATRIELVNKEDPSDIKEIKAFVGNGDVSCFFF